MAQSQFSLSWDEHVQNICSGLSLLQQVTYYFFHIIKKFIIYVNFHHWIYY